MALADVLVDQVHALAPVLAGVAVALVELVFAAVAGVARVAVAGVAGDAVDACPVVAGVRHAVVDVTLTQRAFIAFSTATLEAIGPIVALGSILAGRTGALIDVNLTHGAGKAWLTGACETINHVSTDAIVHTGVTLTVVDIDFTVSSHVSWHADAGELSNAIQTGGIILARHRKTFIDVDFTSWSCISSTTLALERALRVHTLPKMLTGVCTNGTLVHVLVAGAAHKASRTSANGPTVQRVRVTNSSFVTGVTDTGIVQVTQQTCLSNWTLAEERGHTIMTCGSIKTNCCCTIVDGLTAVVSGPAVHAHTGVSTNDVEAGATIVAGVWLHQTFIHVLSTILSCPFWRTLTVVCVDPIHTFASIHALMTRAVVHIILTVMSLEARQTGTLVGMVAGLATCASVEALRRGAGYDGDLTCAPAVAGRALAAERAMGVNAEPSVQAGAGLPALVYVTATVLPLKARWTRAVVMIIPIDTASTVGTGTRGTGVDERAVLASEPSLAHTAVLWDSADHLAFAGPPI